MLRSIMQPAFHRKRLAAFGTLMTGATVTMLDQWQRFTERNQPLMLDYFLFDQLLRCCGMSVTTMPGRASNAAFKRNAVWLCKGYSHQWATTNSGRITVKVSSKTPTGPIQSNRGRTSQQ